MSGYNPYRKDNGEFATKEEVGALVEKDLAEAKASGNSERVTEIENVIMDKMADTPLGQQVLKQRHGGGAIGSSTTKKDLKEMREAAEMVKQINRHDVAIDVYTRAVNEGPLAGAKDRNGNLHPQLRSKINAYIEDNWDKQVTESLSALKKDDPHFFENAVKNDAESLVYIAVENSVNAWANSVKPENDEVGLIDLYRGRNPKLAERKLSQLAKDEILAKEYSDNVYAEPSNILHLMAEEDASIAIESSSFPSDGSRMSDFVTFTNDAGYWSLEAKRDAVFVSLEAEGKNYEMRGEDFGDGYGLQERLLRLLDNSSAVIAHMNGEDSSEHSYVNGKNRTIFDF